MSLGSGPVHSNGHDDTSAEVGLHLVVNDGWCALDLDELRDAIEAAGLPPELIATYLDRTGRRRYVERAAGQKAVTA
jgi:hypothetical protein